MTHRSWLHWNQSPTEAMYRNALAAYKGTVWSVDELTACMYSEQESSFSKGFRPLCLRVYLELNLNLGPEIL